MSNTATPEPDNTGGIAASIIVVLLLLATLGVLLYYYLRTQDKTKAMTGGAVERSVSPSAIEGIANDMYDPHLTVSIMAWGFFIWFKERLQVFLT